MEPGAPFVITVASEKGGVGKTTIATNLAVYLKALREDLPVTIASFDNHFSVDSMFAIGGRRGNSVGGLFAGSLPEDLATLGEYGVAFLASERNLLHPDGDPWLLRRLLARSRLHGILILDTRPILDTFTRNALLAADLVLVPVKDRASLVNAAAIHSAMGDAGDGEDRLWLVPSMIDGRIKLKDNIGILEFLVWSARARGYQVVETGIAKSPKVESLATNLSSRVYPILSHARGTQVHNQFRILAEFVLTRRDAQGRPLAHSRPAGTLDEERPGLLGPSCPVCQVPTPARGHFFQALRSRRRGYLHRDCLAKLVGGGERTGLLAEAVMLAALFDPETGEEELALHLFDRDGQEIVVPSPSRIDACRWRELLPLLADDSLANSWRECLLVDLLPTAQAPAGSSRRDPEFSRLRRQVLRELAALAR
jgi:cellulose biosynthesis protein BcsQ